MLTLVLISLVGGLAGGVALRFPSFAIIVVLASIVVGAQALLTGASLAYAGLLAIVALASLQFGYFLAVVGRCLAPTKRIDVAPEKPIAGGTDRQVAPNSQHRP
jgi:hypothetical protein